MSQLVQEAAGKIDSQTGKIDSQTGKIAGIIPGKIRYRGQRGPDKAPRRYNPITLRIYFSGSFLNKLTHFSGLTSFVLYIGCIFPEENAGKTGYYIKVFHYTYIYVSIVFKFYYLGLVA